MAMTEEPVSKGDILLEEPFRVLFPVGVVGTLLGVVTMGELPRMVRAPVELQSRNAEDSVFRGFLRHGVPDDGPSPVP